MNKKLLILSIFPAPYRVAVFRGLASRYDVTLFFEFVQNQNRNSKWFVESDEFTVLTTPESVEAYERAVRDLRQYDMVLAYDYFSKRAMSLMRRCIRQKVPYCINCDGAFINHNPIKDLIKRYFITHASACFASGRSAGEYFKAFGAKDSQIYYHNFTSLTEADILDKPLTQQEKVLLKQELGLEQKKTVLTIGQFIHRKGNDILLAAWKDMPNDSQLLLIGGGDKAGEYERFIKENQLSDVKILSFMEKKDVFRYYKASDLFVLPTREDIWGLVINEAMACGLPVITTARCIAGLELIENEKNGYIVPAEDPNTLHQKMKLLLADEAARTRMSEANIKKMQGNTMDNIVAEHLKVLDRLLAVK